MPSHFFFPDFQKIISLRWLSSSSKSILNGVYSKWDWISSLFANGFRNCDPVRRPSKIAQRCYRGTELQQFDSDLLPTREKQIHTTSVVPNCNAAVECYLVNVANGLLKLHHKIQTGRLGTHLVFAFRRLFLHFFAHSFLAPAHKRGLSSVPVRIAC